MKNMRKINNIDNLEEIQSIEIGILCSIADFCNLNGLRYYLAHGTLIGAVRHSGFIPWDDDIDLLMPREDFEKFICSYVDPKSGLSADGRFRLGYLSTIDKYNRIFAKVYNTKTTLCETDRSNNFQEGLFVDIWPLDGVPNCRLSRKLHQFRLRVLNSILAASIIYEYTGSSLVKKLFNKIIMPLSKQFVNPHRFAEHIVKVSANKAYFNSRYVINPIAPKKCVYEREWFFNKPAQLTFGNRKFSVPSDYHNVLSVQYGDYMQCPNKEDQHPHHKFIAYVND